MSRLEPPAAAATPPVLAFIGLGWVSRAPHCNHKHTAIRVFYTGTRTVPFGLVAHYLMAVTNTDVYHIGPFNLLP